MFYSQNHYLSSYGASSDNLSFRSDLVYCQIGYNLLIPGDSYGSYGQNVYFIGENFFIRTAFSAPEGYADAQVFQIDTSTAKVFIPLFLANISCIFSSDKNQVAKY